MRSRASARGGCQTTDPSLLRNHMQFGPIPLAGEQRRALSEGAIPGAAVVPFPDVHRGLGLAAPHSRLAGPRLRRRRTNARAACSWPPQCSVRNDVLGSEPRRRTRASGRERKRQTWRLVPLHPGYAAIGS